MVDKKNESGCRTLEVELEKMREKSQSLSAVSQQIESDCRQSQATLKKFQAELIGLRERHDKFINRGDSDEATKCLAEIKSARAKLETFAKKLDGDSTLVDLKTQVESLRLSSQTLYAKTVDVWKRADTTMRAAAVFSSSVPQSLIRALQENETALTVNKKLARQLLE